MVGLVVLSAACNKGEQAGTTPDAVRRNEPQPLVRQECKGGSVQTVDANGDGQPDIRHHVEGSKRACTEIDMNFDGRVDVARFYADDGSVKLEQHDFDFDGNLDEQAHFVSGALKTKELDTNYDGLIDTWLWCNGPLMERAERARRKAGKVDILESYSNGMLAEIQYDENSDGKSEKWEIYRDGQLVEVRSDVTGDGKPDRNDPIASEYEKDPPISCDGTPLPAAAGLPTEPAQPATGGEAAPTTDAEQDLKEDTGEVVPQPTTGSPTDASTGEASEKKADEEKKAEPQPKKKNGKGKDKGDSK